MYSFTYWQPKIQKNMPDDIIRLRNTSLTVSANSMEKFQADRLTKGNGQERVRFIIGIDAKKQAISLNPSPRGYLFQVRSNGNGYLNTTRLGLGLPIGDYQFKKGVFVKL